jgi:ankyrin repeat protein
LWCLVSEVPVSPLQNLLIDIDKYVIICNYVGVIVWGKEVGGFQRLMGNPQLVFRPGGVQVIRLIKAGCIVLSIVGLLGCTRDDRSGSSSGQEVAASPSASVSPTANNEISQRFIGLVELLYQSKGKPDYDQKLDEILALIRNDQVDLNIKTKTTGDTALMLAIQRSQELIPLLLENGVDVNASNHDGVSPLAMAASRQDYPLFQQLLDKGADPLAVTKEGFGVLAFAMQPGYGKILDQENGGPIVQALLAQKADPNTFNTEDQSPLCLAGYYGQKDILRALLEHGADPNRANKAGWTPLMCTASPWVFYDVDNIKDMMNLLIQAKADVNAVNNQGDTALHLIMNLTTAPESDMSPITQLLQHNGAQSDIKK